MEIAQKFAFFTLPSGTLGVSDVDRVIYDPICHCQSTINFHLLPFFSAVPPQTPDHAKKVAALEVATGGEEFIVFFRKIYARKSSPTPSPCSAP